MLPDNIQVLLIDMTGFLDQPIRHKTRRCTCQLQHRNSLILYTVEITFSPLHLRPHTAASPPLQEHIAQGRKVDQNAPPLPIIIFPRSLSASTTASLLPSLPSTRRRHLSAQPIQAQPSPAQPKHTPFRFPFPALLHCKSRDATPSKSWRHPGSRPARAPTNTSSQHRRTCGAERHGNSAVGVVVVVAAAAPNLLPAVPPARL